MSTHDEIVEQAAEFIWEFIHGNWGVYADVQELAAGLADAGLIIDSANAKHECDEVLVNTIRSLGVSIAKREEERDTLAWLHAEAVWKRDQTAEALRGAAIVICDQRDRIDKALALLADTALMPMTIGDYQALKFDVRAALTGGAE